MSAAELTNEHKQGFRDHAGTLALLHYELLRWQDAAQGMHAQLLDLAQRTEAARKALGAHGNAVHDELTAGGASTADIATAQEYHASLSRAAKRISQLATADVASYTLKNADLTSAQRDIDRVASKLDAELEPAKGA